MEKTLDEKIAIARRKKEQDDANLKKLLQQQKEADRKARTKRLCERAGHLESILPDTIALTKEQFEDFLNKTLLTPFAERILKGLLIPPPAPQAKPEPIDNTVAVAEETVSEDSKAKEAAPKNESGAA